ncbi:MAG TPA: radical SAM protein [Candidatus Copromonas faecavium]|uniref:Radical SAM protein n=1 Tax=Candidatus Copromonas faecavium (nom. illeg.) TaxID=2840740 RepID=A0A9D1A6Y6_9FIRM|nr:radical SAM protein [Candidatus Copromonas faecavium]
MDYEGQICRPPMERGSYKLPVAVGCSYNQCKFCGLFKHLTYREISMETVEKELLRVQGIGGYPMRIFLGDGNPFGLPAERLFAILDLIHKYFPRCQQISMDATITNLREKTDREMRELYEHGVRELYLGIECGLDDVLSFMRKDHGIEEAYCQLSRLERSGIAYSAHLMLGLAGKGRWEENAEATAHFINRTRPKKIINTSIFLSERTPLFREIEKGNFHPADELENLREEYRLLELLDVEIESYDGFHDNLEVRTRGQLPRDKEKMLHHLKEAIDREELRTAEKESDKTGERNGRKERCRAEEGKVEEDRIEKLRKIS